MLSCFLDDLTHSFIHWWMKLHTSAVTAPLIYMSVQNLRAKLHDRSCISLLCFLRTGSRVTACHGATMVICMHVMQTVWDWQTWLRACEAQWGPGTCAMRRELQSISVSALRRALPRSYRESSHHWSTQDAIKCLVKGLYWVAWQLVLHISMDLHVFQYAAEIVLFFFHDNFFAHSGWSQPINCAT